jgi:hypothetical protein
MCLEVSRLPGCGSKIAELYQHWIDTGAVKEVKDAESDSRLSVLKVFYDIWGVGDHTAREFYKKGAFRFINPTEGWAFTNGRVQDGVTLMISLSTAGTHSAASSRSASSFMRIFRKRSLVMKSRQSRVLFFCRRGRLMPECR